MGAKGPHFPHILRCLGNELGRSERLKPENLHKHIASGSRRARVVDAITIGVDVQERIGTIIPVVRTKRTRSYAVGECIRTLESVNERSLCPK
jgi:hypothetical protein